MTYSIVDTSQKRCYNNSKEIEYPAPDRGFFGQDAQYRGNQPAYQDHGDGTVSDLNTGLMWTQDPGDKKSFAKAVAGAPKCKIGGHADWRLPSIKELYSLILFNGIDPDPKSRNRDELRPFINPKFFKFQYGQAKYGDRLIDSQFASSTLYSSVTMLNNQTMFGVNFADGRIKGYGLMTPKGEKTFYALYVRGNPEYGKNKFVDNGDGTILDHATGLMWTKADSGETMTWGQALAWAENLDSGGYSDWRLPNIKELQSIVDYSRCPDATKSATIDPVFEATAIEDEEGNQDYAYYWSSTSHCNLQDARNAAYIAFGRALGWVLDLRTNKYRLLDVHGAGSQRSDPKTGEASQFPRGRGPQEDIIRIKNMARAVRGGVAEPCLTGPAIKKKPQSPPWRP
ncbi:MAG: DUF1566 domain-containing protein [Planctomycetes bacterium]|nr:DUF1566 domain-containing protein [Planctomycetota bacterium]